MPCPKVAFAQLVFLAAVVCGVIGLVTGFADRELKLGVAGWFTGGTLAAVLAIAVYASHYFDGKGTNSN